MKRNLAIKAIRAACSGDAGFSADAVGLAKAVGIPSAPDLISLLLECGVIPEQFGHDSSEEKLYAKYCDVLLMRAFNDIGIASQVIERRGESADVEGITRKYSIVGDTKAFRLSRTAKNQKDFKVEALSQWRGTKNYACLVCPLYHYPNTNSQIYWQASTYKVTLLGYVHLAFIVKHSRSKKHNLEAIWKLGHDMSPSKNADAYWRALDGIVVSSVAQEPCELVEFKKKEAKLLEAMKKEELNYWNTESERVSQLSHEEAIRQLRISMKIHEKIRQIEKVTY